MRQVFRVLYGTPSSAAALLMRSQFHIAPTWVQFGTIVKAMSELFANRWNGYGLSMDEEAEAAFINNFRRRIKELRMMRGFTQKDAADFLGLALEAYKKYENRSILPAFLMPRFCRLIGCELKDLFVKPMAPPPPARGRPPKHGKH